MTHVFVVRVFFSDNNDTTYVGAFTSFEKAAQAAIAYMEKDERDPEEGFRIHDTKPGDTDVWLEETWKGQELGIYYTIDKLEVK